MRTMPKFSISVNRFPEHRYISNAPEYLGGHCLNGGRMVQTDLKHIGWKSKVRCWGPFWVRKNYWRFIEYYNDANLGFVDVLNSFDIIPPKWVCRLFKWNTNV